MIMYYTLSTDGLSNLEFQSKFIIQHGISILMVIKADSRLTQNIAYIYEILHCNHFLSYSNANEYGTTTINWCPSLVVVLIEHRCR